MLVNLFKLSDEELLRGLTTIEQLQREVSSSYWSLRDIKDLFLLPYYMIKWDLEDKNIIQKSIFILFWWPIYYIVYYLCIL